MTGLGIRFLSGLAVLAALASCARVDRVAEPSVPAPAAPSALLAGVAPGPAFHTLGISAPMARRALASFIESCPKLLRREDASGLTRTQDWQSACAAAPATPPEDALRFFSLHFEPVRIGTGEAFATGYFEPEIAGTRQRQPGFETPVYGMPEDLVRAWPADWPESERQGRPPLGRLDEAGRHQPYFTRAEIEDGALDGRAPILGWAADPVELFFLQIQGSGRLIAPDGSVMRIGYAGQNGHGYTAIGALLREQGLLGSGPGQYPASMQGIMAYIRDHPAEGRALMRRNESWVFFRELTGDGPLGALEVPVRPRVSAAADPLFVPLGAPVVLDLERREANGLWIAQDTGGAIKGANRFDTFWGAGEDARAIAGTMSARGSALLLLPRGTLARLRAP